MINSPPGQEWYKDPKILIIGGVAIFGMVILLRNQNNTTSSTSPGITSQTTDPTAMNTGNNAIGGTYSYLDGSGVQHIIATDPNGNLVNYAALPPDTGNPQVGQLSSYVGSMGMGTGAPAGGGLYYPYIYGPTFGNSTADPYQMMQPQ